MFYNLCLQICIFLWPRVSSRAERAPYPRKYPKTLQFWAFNTCSLINGWNHFMLGDASPSLPFIDSDPIPLSHSKSDRKWSESIEVSAIRCLLPLQASLVFKFLLLFYSRKSYLSLTECQIWVGIFREFTYTGQ